VWRHNTTKKKHYSRFKNRYLFLYLITSPPAQYGQFGCFISFTFLPFLFSYFFFHLLLPLTSFLNHDHQIPSSLSISPKPTTNHIPSLRSSSGRCSLIASIRHATPCNTLKNPFNFRGAVSKTVRPERIPWVLNQLNECDKKSPWMRSVHD